MTGIGPDFRLAFRMLGRNPGFTAVTILSLALGIGTTTAMFSLVYAVLIHPYPYRDVDRLANPFIYTRAGGPYWFTLTGSQ